MIAFEVAALSPGWKALILAVAVVLLVCEAVPWAAPRLKQRVALGWLALAVVVAVYAWQALARA